MAAVVETAAHGMRALPMLHAADAARTVAWHVGHRVDVAEFLADVATVAGTLPFAREAINLCEDRYAFLVAFCAVISRGQTNLLPSSRAPQAIEEALRASAGSYAISDLELTPVPGRWLQLPPLGRGAAIGAEPAVSVPMSSVPMIAGDHIAAIGFTSGSTGQPKPNNKTWAAFNASNMRNAEALARTLGLCTDELAHVVATVPPQHKIGRASCRERV